MPESPLHRDMKKAVGRLYEDRGFRTLEESTAGTSDSSVYVRYNWVDVCAWVKGGKCINFECETRFSLKRFREKSLRLRDERRRGSALYLVVPQCICRDYRWIWGLGGYYDAVLVYNQEKDAITNIHYLRT